MAQRKEVRDESKLPQWAQTELVRLRANVNHWKQKADAVAGEIPSNVHLIEGMEKKPLPPQSVVRFLLSNLEADQVTCRVRNGRLDLSSGDYPMMILPRCANGIHIVLNKDRDHP